MPAVQLGKALYNQYDTIQKRTKQSQITDILSDIYDGSTDSVEFNQLLNKTLKNKHLTKMVLEQKNETSLSALRANVDPTITAKQNVIMQAKAGAASLALTAAYSIQDLATTRISIDAMRARDRVKQNNIKQWEEAGKSFLYLFDFLERM